MKRKYPDGPNLNFPAVLIGLMLPSRYPFDPLAFYLGIARKYGDIAYYRLGPLRVYQLNQPDLVRQVLVDQAPKFHKPVLLKRGGLRALGQGLLTSDGALWKRQRKLMQPAFRHERLVEAYGGLISTYVAQMLDSFRDGAIRNISEDMGRLTLAVVVKSLFGEEVPGDGGKVAELLLAVAEAANQRANNPLQAPSWIPNRRNRLERRALVRLDQIIRDLIGLRRQSSDHHSDLLSALLGAVDSDDGGGMSDRQLRDEMMTLFLAGQDTTAHALSWVWYLLARHPEVEKKLLDEIRCVLAGRTPVAADLAKLPYTEMVVREAMRLFPPAPAFGREPIEDVTVGQWEIKKGSLITVSVYALHRDPRFFAEPEKFDPERFAPGWEERIPRYAYFPFGGGPRVCIGNGFAMLEARLVLATVAQRWRLSMEPNVEIAPKQLVTLRPSQPLRMIVEKRVQVDDPL